MSIPATTKHGADGVSPATKCAKPVRPSICFPVSPSGLAAPWRLTTYR